MHWQKHSRAESLFGLTSQLCTMYAPPGMATLFAGYIRTRGVCSYTCGDVPHETTRAVLAPTYRSSEVSKLETRCILSIQGSQPCDDSTMAHTHTHTHTLAPRRNPRLQGEDCHHCILLSRHWNGTARRLAHSAVGVLQGEARCLTEAANSSRGGGRLSRALFKSRTGAPATGSAVVSSRWRTDRKLVTVKMDMHDPGPHEPFPPSLGG